MSDPYVRCKSSAILSAEVARSASTIVVDEMSVLGTKGNKKSGKTFPQWAVGERAARPAAPTEDTSLRRHSEGSPRFIPATASSSMDTVVR